MDKKIKERGIIFNGEMVRAILDGRKTQTRSMLSPLQLKMIDTASSVGECYPLDSGQQHENSQSYYREWCPFGQVGDRLWVRETFRLFDSSVECSCEDHCSCYRYHGLPIYRANRGDSEAKWTPSSKMPRWASRITLEITDIRVERLQDISEEGALSEGIDADKLNESQDNYDCIADHNFTGRPTAVSHFSYLWESLYGQDSWQTNPWVWVISFRRVEAA